MLKNIKRFVLVLVCLGIVNNSDVSASTGIDNWGNTIFDAFQKLVSKELLSFGKSDRAATTKDELLDRSKALRESLGGFAEVVKSSKEKPEKHEEKHSELAVKPVENNVSTPVVAPAPAPAPVAAPEVHTVPAVLPVAPVVPAMPVVAAPVAQAPVPVPEVHAASPVLPVIPAAPPVALSAPAPAPVVVPVPVAPALPAVPAVHPAPAV